MFSSTISIAEGSTIDLQIKIMTPDGNIEDFIPTETHDISWKTPDFNFALSNKSQIRYTVPGYNHPEQLIPIQAQINYSSELSTTIKVLQREITAGYSIKTLQDGQVITQNNCSSNQQQHVMDALAAIQTDDPEMYNAVFGTNEITIVFNNGGQTGKRIIFGDSNFDYLPDHRLIFDPNLIENHGSAEGDYADCPKSGEFLLAITGDEYAQIESDIVEIIPNDELENEIPPVVLKIKEVYPNIGLNLENYCRNQETENVANYKAHLEALRTDKKLAYKIEISELPNYLSLRNYGTINLNVDNIDDVTNYINVVFCSGLMSGDPETFWANQATCSEKNQVRKKKYKQVLAHEIAHLYFRIQNTPEAYLWKKLEDTGPISCFPAHSELNDEYCSTEDGHIYKNPDGIFVCNKVHVELNYDDPNVSCE